MRTAKRAALLLAAMMLLSCLLGSAGLAAAALPDVIPGRGLYVEENEEIGPVLAGLQAVPTDGPTPMDVIMCFDIPGDWTCVVEDPEGEDISIREEPVATGDAVVFSDGADFTEALTVVVRGDVLGNGRLNIGQLTAMAQVLTGQRTLTGPYALAGDLNGSGAIDIGDLTSEARLLQSNGRPAPPEGYPRICDVAQAAYLLNPREGGDIYVADGHVVGPLASAVLYALIDLHAKWDDPDAPTEGLLGYPDGFNSLLLDVLSTCRVEPIDSDVFEYRFEADRIVALLNALFGFDVTEDLRASVEIMEGDVFWRDGYIELSGVGVGGSVVTYSGIGMYPSPTDTYEFESRITYYSDGEDEMVASMWFTARILPEADAPFGFLMESCRFSSAAG